MREMPWNEEESKKHQRRRRENIRKHQRRLKCFNSRYRGKKSFLWLKKKLSDRIACLVILSSAAWVLALADAKQEPVKARDLWRPGGRRLYSPQSTNDAVEEKFTRVLHFSPITRPYAWATSTAHHQRLNGRSHVLISGLADTVLCETMNWALVPSEV